MMRWVRAVHAVAPVLVLVGVVGASVAQAVALAEGAVQHYVVRVVLAQSAVGGGGG
jgi:hypothetical protein